MCIRRFSSISRAYYFDFIGILAAETPGFSHGVADVSSDNYNNDTWNLVSERNANDKMSYIMGTIDGEANVISGQEILSTTVPQVVNLYINLSEEAKVGRYTDTITFTSEIKDNIKSINVDLWATGGNILVVFEDGMTWGEWVNSEYNTYGITISNSGYLVKDENVDGWLQMYCAYVLENDVISEDIEYYFNLTEVVC